jgi:hypothetical protein
MRRRDVLSTGRVAIAGGIVALAGCSSGGGQSTATDEPADTDAETDTATTTATATEAYTGCPPDDAAPGEIVPPESDSFTNRRSYDPTADDPDGSIDAAAAAGAQYEGSDGAYYVLVHRFENQEATAEGYRSIRQYASEVGPTVAFAMWTNHAIFGRGQSESGLRDLLCSSQYVGEDCLRNFRFE